MKEDLIVEEIRELRKLHAARFNYDLRAICADLREKEKDYGHRVVSLPAKIHLKAARG
jgi:hypothetical protein